MVAEKTDILGEFLYYILRFEKSRKKKGVWLKKYKKELNKSMLTCLEIIDCLDYENITSRDYLCIKTCLNHPYIFKMFDENNMLSDIANVELTNKVSIIFSQRKSVNKAIKIMINNIIVLMNKQQKGYKNDIARLLQCLHNFPRFYLINYNQGIWYMNYNQIKEYAKFYFNDEELSILF